VVDVEGEVGVVVVAVDVAVNWATRLWLLCEN